MGLSDLATLLSPVFFMTGRLEQIRVWVCILTAHFGQDIADAFLLFVRGPIILQRLDVKDDLLAKLVLQLPGIHGGQWRFDFVQASHFRQRAAWHG